MTTLPRLEFPPIRTDYSRGLRVPQTIVENIEYRQKLLTQAENDKDLQALLWQMCADNLSFFCDTFVWTYKQREYDQTGKMTGYKGKTSMHPWLMWPVHEELAEKMMWCEAEGLPLVIAKSRDMRVSWFLILYAYWRARFKSNMWTGLLTSRKEALVDGPDPDTLFYRLRYVHKNLPAWMRRGAKSKHLSFRFGQTGASIDGASTTGDIGVGGRRDLLLLDEAARMRSLEQVWDAARDTATFLIANSTPKGRGYFKELYKHGGHPRFLVNYSQHPDKGRGAELRIDDTGVYTGKAGTEYIWTPWLEREVYVANRSRISMGENVMVDFDLASGGLFDSDVLHRIIAAASSFPPVACGIIRHAKSGEDQDNALRHRKLDQIKFEAREVGKGTLTLWIPVRGGRPADVRPNICLFADVSDGINASNSVISVGDADTCEVIGMWVSSSVGPESLARVLVMLGLWFGTRDRPAMISWEANGPGSIMGHHVTRLRYPNIWTPPNRRAGQLGWWSTPDEKVRVLIELRSAWARGELTDPDPLTAQEAMDYVYFNETKVGPYKLGEDAEARATHGDRVISRAGLWQMMLTRRPTRPVIDELPPRSVAARLATMKAKRRKALNEW
jgi:hypothetical protein